ncbi:MAG: glutamate racemase [Pseudomonadota bacterium]
MPSTSSPTPPDAPIGIFDSGVGGLSVLRHIRAQLPHEHLLYFADSGHAPYGGKTEQYVVERSLAITDFLLARGAKALVVACNTATVAAIKAVRARYPDLPIVGVEPGLKPAAAATRSGKIGVLATARTLSGEKFLLLREQISSASQAEFLLQPCVGLVDLIEQGELDTPATDAMVRHYVAPLLEQGADTLVLGCTHYPFVRPAIERAVALGGERVVTLIDTGDAVARQLTRLLDGAGLRRPASDGQSALLHSYTTANSATLSAAFASLLGLAQEVEALVV